MVVLPTPGGPQKISDASDPRPSIRVIVPSGPSRWSWPTTSPSVTRAAAGRPAGFSPARSPAPFRTLGREQIPRRHDTAALQAGAAVNRSCRPCPPSSCQRERDVSRCVIAAQVPPCEARSSVPPLSIVWVETLPFTSPRRISRPHSANGNFSERRHRRDEAVIHDATSSTCNVPDRTPAR